jgi:hypothetical protein
LCFFLCRVFLPKPLSSLTSSKMEIPFIVLISTYLGKPGRGAHSRALSSRDKPTVRLLEHYRKSVTHTHTHTHTPVLWLAPRATYYRQLFPRFLFSTIFYPPLLGRRKTFSAYRSLVADCSMVRCRCWIFMS